MGEMGVSMTVAMINSGREEKTGEEKEEEKRK
jgi:hypothetical protein